MKNARDRRPGAKPAGRQASAAESAPDIGRLLDLIGAFDQQTIAVVGDFVVDEFVSGQISRVSREAPVLILQHRETESLPGGGANAVNNLVDLGARVLPVGVVGDDAAGNTLIEYLRAKRVDVSGIVRARGWTTTTKTRFLAGWTHTTEQQVLRVDRQSPEPPEKSRDMLLRKAQQRVRRAKAVLISDYGLGAVSPELVRRLKAKHIALDSRYSLLDYADAGITAATPNEAEIESIYHTPIGSNVAQLAELGQSTLDHMKLGALLITRGKDGMALFERGRAATFIPIYGTDEAADVTGAGDTVIAVLTLAIAAGATYLEAAHLANYAGGIVVMKRRTATVTRAELEAALQSEATALPDRG